MPEGDTVHRTCARLHDALAGRELLAAELRWPGLSTADLAGMTVLEVGPLGKHILIRLDSGLTLHSHLKMEGQWRIERTAGRNRLVEPVETATATAAGQRNRLVEPVETAAAISTGSINRHDVRAVLVTEPWTALGLRLGQLHLVRTAEEARLVGHLGPDILSAGFDASRAVANLAASDTTIGAALLDQTNLAGIGTLWASESLFLQGLGPWRPAADVTPSDLAALVERARRLMSANLPHVVQSSTGARRKGENTYVHARSGRPCRRCGTTVRVAPIGPPTRERTMFYCPGCQGGLAPTDDGRPMAPLGARRRPRQ